MHFDQYANALKIASEPTRLRLLSLCARGELAVSDLVHALGQSQPRVSRHLKVLCDGGLLERYRDGHWVYFRVPLLGPESELVHRVLELVQMDEPPVSRDHARLDALLGGEQPEAGDPMLRRFNRLLLSYFLTHPVGELLDIGVGSGAVLKLLAPLASRATGIDTDLGARRETRRAMARSALKHCTIRPGDAHAIDFGDDTFDTVVLDEVLLTAERPGDVLHEACRVMRPTGRALLVEHLAREDIEPATSEIRALAKDAGLRLGAFRRSSDYRNEYLVAEASQAVQQTESQSA